MIVIGLTGSIGMGKTTVATMCQRLGIPVDSADAAVHRLLAPGGAGFAPVAQQFPHAVSEGRIDRRLLGAMVFSDPAALDRLESILHPLVAHERRRFITAMARRGAAMVVLDIPLLFERGLTRGLDAVITVSAPAFVQRARVLARPGTDAARYRDIMARQMSDAGKRHRSDFVIRTGGTKADTLKQLQRILKRIDSDHARNRSRHRNHRARPARRAPDH